MASLKQILIEEIQATPPDLIPKIYKIFHFLKDEFSEELPSSEKRGSVKGIWKDSLIDDSLYEEAKKSLFPYEKN
ncbi:MAG: hypothetical protein HQM15_00475 [Deltaproteobacteria bacterium]|nr:hypothetical protein [Deltaproteobacteria bacterium]